MIGGNKNDVSDVHFWAEFLELPVRKANAVMKFETSSIIVSGKGVFQSKDEKNWKKRIPAFETKCLRKLFGISYLEHKTCDWVRSKINFLDPQEPLLASVNRQKLAWFGHVNCHGSLSQTILQGTLEGGHCYGWQKKWWLDNIKEWTFLPMPELLTMASCRKGWKRISAESSLMSLWQPSQLRNWTELN